MSTSSTPNAALSPKRQLETGERHESIKRLIPHAPPAKGDNKSRRVWARGRPVWGQFAPKGAVRVHWPGQPDTAGLLVRFQQK